MHHKTCYLLAAADTGPSRDLEIVQSKYRGPFSRVTGYTSFEDDDYEISDDESRNDSFSQDRIEAAIQRGVGVELTLHHRELLEKYFALFSQQDDDDGALTFLDMYASAGLRHHSNRSTSLKDYPSGCAGLYHKCGLGEELVRACSPRVVDRLRKDKQKLFEQIIPVPMGEGVGFQMEVIKSLQRRGKFTRKGIVARTGALLFLLGKDMREALLRERNGEQSDMPI
jgi:hypothetical protein